MSNMSKPDFKSHPNVIYSNSLFRAIQGTGISKSMLRYVMQNQFAISSTQIKDDCLIEYNLLYHDSDYFFPQIRDGMYRGYQVIYKDSLSGLKESPQLALSFRAAIDNYGLEKYVLVKRGNK